jgi:hypothetical protein
VSSHAKIFEIQIQRCGVREKERRMKEKIEKDFLCKVPNVEGEYIQSLFGTL